jgi:hypothetical protein
VLSSIIKSVLFTVGTALLLYRLVDLIRSPRRPAMWALWAGILTLILALAVGTLGSVLSAATMFLVQHVLILCSVLLAERFFWFSLYPPRSPHPPAWRSMGPLIFFMIAMIATFVVTMRVEHPDFGAIDYPRQHWAMLCVLCYSAGFAAVYVPIARLAWRWSRAADEPWLRRGLTTLTVGTWVGLVYAVHHVAYIVVLTLGFDPYFQALAEMFPIAISILLSFAGATMPAFGPRLSAGYLWVRHLRAWWRLRPLWQAFYRARPDIRLPVPLPLRDMEGAVRRRVVEIWDGRSRVRTFMRPEVRDRAFTAGRERGLEGDELAAVVEAEVWRDALARLTRGDEPDHTEVVVAPLTGDTLPAAVAWLERVARAMKQPSVLDARPARDERPHQTLGGFTARRS